jgi:hypothetical protein
MYNIELIGRNTCWKGDKGVVMHCTISSCRIPPDPPGHCSVGDIRKYDVTVWGTTEPTVWIKLIDSHSGYVYPTIITGPALNEEVRQ